MIKTLAVCGVVAIAISVLASPGSADAEGKLIDPINNLVAVGKEVTITSDPLAPLVIETGLGTIECEEVMANGEVTENTGFEFEIRGAEVKGSFGTATNCSLEGSVPVVFKRVKISKIQSTVTKRGIIWFSFIIEIGIPPNTFQCQFDSIPNEASVFHYALTSSTATVTPWILESAVCGEAEIGGGLVFETPGGVAIVLE